MDMEKVVQAFSAQMYTSVLDVLQQIDPLTDLDPHATRSRLVVHDLADWLVQLTREDLSLMQQTRSYRSYLPQARWLQEAEGYDATAVCAAAQLRIFAGLDMARQNGIDGYQLIHGTGEYLRGMDDHKTGWLAERAANLLARGM